LNDLPVFLPVAAGNLNYIDPPRNGATRNQRPCVILERMAHLELVTLIVRDYFEGNRWDLLGPEARAPAPA